MVPVRVAFIAASITRDAASRCPRPHRPRRCTQAETERRTPLSDEHEDLFGLEE